MVAARIRGGAGVLTAALLAAACTGRADVNAPLDGRAPTDIVASFNAGPARNAPSADLLTDTPELVVYVDGLALADAADGTGWYALRLTDSELASLIADLAAAGLDGVPPEAAPVQGTAPEDAVAAELLVAAGGDATTVRAPGLGVPDVRYAGPIEAVHATLTRLRARVRAANVAHTPQAARLYVTGRLGAQASGESGPRIRDWPAGVPVPGDLRDASRDQPVSARVTGEALATLLRDAVDGRHLWRVDEEVFVVVHRILLPHELVATG